MKKILAFVVMVLAVGQVNANVVNPKTPLGMSVVKSGNICKLFYRGEQSGKVEVTIYNERGRVVFNEVIRKTDNFMRPYNFTTLPEGNYRIELNDGQTTHFEKVSHFRPRNERAVNLVRVNRFEDKYVLAVANKGHDTLTIRIFDENNALLYKNTEAVEGDFARVYNLNGVKGRYFFEVTDHEGRVNRLSRQSVR